MNRYKIERMKAAQEFALSRFEYFKSQDVEQGFFDVAFEVEGKIIRAHKFILAPVSEPLKAMMSPRWSADGETIKIKECSYDAFFEFFCYLYSCDCNISKDNIIELTDIAESYSVPAFKDFCDYFLSEMGLDIEEFYDMLEFVEKYSLPYFKKSLERFFFQNFEKLTNDTIFMNLKHQIIMVLSVYRTRDREQKELFFTSVYKWAEYQARKIQGVNESNLHEAIKTKLIEVLPVLDLSDLTFKFVVEYIMPKGFLFSFNSLLRILSKCMKPYNDEEEAEYYVKTVMGLIERHHSSQTESETANFSYCSNSFFDRYLFKQLSFDFVMQSIVAKNSFFHEADYYKFLNKCKRCRDQEEKLFETVYRLAEANVLEKQKVSPETNFDLLTATQKELRPEAYGYNRSLEDFKFWNMSREFIKNFVVAKRILSEDQSREIWNIAVSITGAPAGVDFFRTYSSKISGTLEDNFGLFDDIEFVQSYCAYDNDKKLRFKNLKKYDIPGTPSTVKKTKDYEWYLCFEKDGTLALKHVSMCENDDYLLAEMRCYADTSLNDSHNYEIHAQRTFRVFEDDEDW